MNHFDDTDEDDEDDICGVIGNGKDPRSPVCVLERGHAGPHREILVTLSQIAPPSSDG